MNTANFDIVIVGAGIAGSVLARILAENSISVLLLEKDAYSGKTNACGGLLDKEHFDKCQISQNVIEQKISQNTFVLPWGEVTFDADQVTVKRSVFDRALADLAQQKGADLRNQSKVLDYEIDSSGKVICKIQDISNRENYTVESSMIAFCDGPLSLARKNPRFNSDKNEPYWAYAYAYETEGVPLKSDQVKIYFDKKLFPWGYGWIFPNKQESNVGVGALLKFAKKKAGIKEKQTFFLNEFTKTAPLLKSCGIKDKKGGYLPMKLIRHFVDDAQVVLGDAAGMVSPLFGAGIDYAIDAAVIYAEVILECFREQQFDQGFLRKIEYRLQPLLGDLKKQAIVAKLVILSRRFGKSWPIKIMAVIAFGAKYSRWDKIKILCYPLFGKPSILQTVSMDIEHK